MWSCPSVVGDSVFYGLESGQQSITLQQIKVTPHPPRVVRTTLSVGFGFRGSGTSLHPGCGTRPPWCVCVSAAGCSTARTDAVPHPLAARGPSFQPAYSCCWSLCVPVASAPFSPSPGREAGAGSGRRAAGVSDCSKVTGQKLGIDFGFTRRG